MTNAGIPLVKVLPVTLLVVVTAAVTFIATARNRSQQQHEGVLAEGASGRSVLGRAPDEALNDERMGNDSAQDPNGHSKDGAAAAQNGRVRDGTDDSVMMVEEF